MRLGVLCVETGETIFVVVNDTLRPCRWCTSVAKSRFNSEAWIAPSFHVESDQRVVTFRFPEENGAARCCLSSTLSRFEYFQKALGRWQEGASAEVVVSDATTQTFDLLLRYFHTGEVDGKAGLEGCLGLLELGNKYLLSHLVAICMTKILRSSVATTFLFIAMMPQVIAL